MAAAGLNQCSAVTRRRSGSATAGPAAMHSSASCASCMAGVAKKHSLVATSGSPAPSASAIRPGSTARSSASPCRCNSTTARSPNASAIAASIASASACRPSASSRPSGPRVPPVSRISPAAWSSTVRSGSCGSAGSDCVKPSEDRRCRLARPAASCASSTTGSGARSGLVRPHQADLAADDRLHALPRAGLAELQRAEQVAGVGDGHRGHPRLPRQGRDLVGLDRALAQRVGGVAAEMDEIGVRHDSCYSTAIWTHPAPGRILCAD